MSDLFDFYPYAERFGVNRELPESGRSREEILGELREMATEEDAVWEDGQVLGDHVLRRPRPLRLPQGGVRPLRAPERAAAGHVPERHPVRGRDHRDGARPDARGRRCNGAEPAGMVTSGGSASIAQAVLAYREQGARGARDRAAEPGQARDRPSRLRQGLPPVRRRDAARRGRSRDDAGPARDGRRADRREHGRDRRLGRQLRLRDDRSDRGAGRAGARARRRAARRRLPGRLPAALRRAARLPDPALRLPGARA